MVYFSSSHTDATARIITESSMSKWLSPSLASLLRPWHRAAESISYGLKLPFYRTLDRYKLNNLDRIYNEEYFNKRNERPYDKSTKFVVDVFNKEYNFDSVFDIGCAIGVYLKYFEDQGVKNIGGLEGSKKAVNNALVSGVNHDDIRDSPKIAESYDLVLCIEVAEHIHPIYAEGLIGTVLSATHSKSTIVFSAARPGQYGTHHINLQHPQYWKNLFRERGWEYQQTESAIIKAKIREKSSKPLIMTENLMIFTNDRNDVYHE